MSLSIQQYIDQVRSVHPAFSRYMVPDKALADFATREQLRLLTLAIARDRTYLSQSLSILFDLANADLDAPGTAGNATVGGVPGISDGAGGYKAVQATTGSAVAVADGTVSVTDTAVSSATTTTLTGLAVSWTVNAYQNRVVLIVAGTGQGQAPRVIASNTATTLTVSAAFAITPDATSVFRVVAGNPTLDGTLGVVTDLPATTINRGYLVKLTAQGTPYLDYTAPLVGHVSRGIPLPSYLVVLGGTVRYGSASATGSVTQTDYGATPLSLVGEAMRFAPPRPPAAYLRNQQLFLCGNRNDWAGVESIGLHYTPVPPAFVFRTDLFLLPDAALPVLAAKGAVFAASRITGLADVPQPPSDLLVAQATEAEAAFLANISLTRRARIGRVRPGGS